jgi:Phage integrase family
VTARELPDLLRAFDGYAGGEHTRLALQLLALTFVRTSELIGARWPEFDLKACRWDVPAERMKLKTPHTALRREHIELQLAHQERNAVSASYNHAMYLEPRARMMQAWVALHRRLGSQTTGPLAESMLSEAFVANRRWTME